MMKLLGKWSSENAEPKQLDILTCNMRLSECVVDELKEVERVHNVTVNYSLNETGSVPNADWIMENTGRSVKNVYFNGAIDEYKYVLGSNHVVIEASDATTLEIDQNYIDTTLAGGIQTFTGSTVEFIEDVTMEAEYLIINAAAGSTITIEGNNHTITVSSASAWQRLLQLNNTDTCTVIIRNLNIVIGAGGIADDGAGIVSGAGTAGLDLTIDNCSVTIGDATGTNNKGFGGLVGAASISQIQKLTLTNNSVSIGNVDGEFLFFGGLVGKDCKTHFNNLELDIKDNNVSIGTIGSTDTIQNAFGGLCGFGFIANPNSNDISTLEVNRNTVTIGNIITDVAANFGGFFGESSLVHDSATTSPINEVNMNNNTVTISNVTNAQYNSFGGLCGFRVMSQGNITTLNTNNNIVSIGDVISRVSSSFAGLYGQACLIDGTVTTLEANNNNVTIGNVTDTEFNNVGGLLGYIMLNNSTTDSVTLNNNVVSIGDIVSGGSVNGGGLTNYGTYGGFYTSGSSSVTTLTANNNTITYSNITTSTTTFFGGLLARFTFSDTTNYIIDNNNVSFGTITSLRNNYFGGLLGYGVGIGVPTSPPNTTFTLTNNIVTYKDIIVNSGGTTSYNSFGGLVGTNSPFIGTTCTYIINKNKVYMDSVQLIDGDVASANEFGGILGWGVAANYNNTLNIDYIGNRVIIKSITGNQPQNDEYGHIHGGYSPLTPPTSNITMKSTYTLGKNYFVNGVTTAGPYDGLEVVRAADRIVFAQLCKKLTEVKVNDAKVFELSDVNGNPYLLTTEEFINMFYKHNGVFSLTDCNSDVLTLTQQDSEDQVWYVNGEGLKLNNLVIQQWEDDIGVESSCWAPCSLLCIMNELLHANNLCNLKCNVCCSVTLEELIALLNSRDQGGADERDELGGPITGDRVSLSVLFMNDNTDVKPVELRLNMRIQN
jgi:hypothetical protein